MNDDLVIIHTAYDNAEADIIKGLLENEGIPVFIQGYNHHSMLGKAGAAIDLNIMVSARDAERAKNCIAQVEISESRKEKP